MILKIGSTYSGAIDAFGYAVNILGGGKICFILANRKGKGCT